MKILYEESSEVSVIGFCLNRIKLAYSANAKHLYKAAGFNGREVMTCIFQQLQISCVWKFGLCEWLVAFLGIVCVWVSCRGSPLRQLIRTHTPSAETARVMHSALQMNSTQNERNEVMLEFDFFAFKSSSAECSQGHCISYSHYLLY